MATYDRLDPANARSRPRYQSPRRAPEPSEMQWNKAIRAYEAKKVDMLGAARMLNISNQRTSIGFKQRNVVPYDSHGHKRKPPQDDAPPQAGQEVWRLRQAVRMADGGMCEKTLLALTGLDLKTVDAARKAFHKAGDFI